MKALHHEIIHKLENYFQLSVFYIYQCREQFNILLYLNNIFSLENIALCNISQFQQNYPSLFTGLQFSFHDSSS